MGTNVTTLSFHGALQEQVVRAYCEYLSTHRAFISPQRNGWVTVFDEECDFGAAIEQSVPLVCRACACPAVVLVVSDSDYVSAWMYTIKGNLIDHFKVEAPIRGNEATYHRYAASICAIAGNGVTLDRALDAFRTANSVDVLLWNLVELFGIEHSGLTFCELYADQCNPTREQGKEGLWDDWKCFEFVNGIEVDDP